MSRSEIRRLSDDENDEDDQEDDEDDEEDDDEDADEEDSDEIDEEDSDESDDEEDSGEDDGEDDGESGDEDDDMPQEAKMRMRNVGRQTITSSGPNSFGKTRAGFVDANKLFERQLQEAMDEVSGDK